MPQRSINCFQAFGQRFFDGQMTFFECSSFHTRFLGATAHGVDEAIIGTYLSFDLVLMLSHSPGLFFEE